MSQPQTRCSANGGSFFWFFTVTAGFGFLVTGLSGGKLCQIVQHWVLVRCIGCPGDRRSSGGLGGTKTLPLILYVFAFVLFCIGAWNPPFPRSFVAAGLAFWVLAIIFERAGGISLH